ncbi:UDP-glucose:glycoprotein glucosyltransferase-domain-containing protein [Mortierella sp. GBAus27b]|nr:UDP-glucose:glycoprotein glucosyltransferase-domain-containing protein [Mortierella sp. GBAus27b]
MVAMQAAMADVAPSPPIRVSIHTSWTSPPLLLEILEAVAVENKSSYYPLMRHLTEPGFLDQVKSDQDLYTKSLEIIKNEGFVSPQALSTLKWSLAMHTTAPWVEAHYHLYNSTIVPDRTSKQGFDPSCGVWVDWYDRQICTASELEATVAGELAQYANKVDVKPTTMDLDHVQSSRSDPGLFAILYADVYDPEFIKFRRYLDKLSKEHGLQYSIRYRPPISSVASSPLVLAGYGVELALKSTDYIVIDDRDLGHGDGGATGQTVLKAETGQSLFGDDVPSVEPVHQADVANLGVLAAQFVLQSQDPLKTLVAVTQDFPKYQHRIAKIALNTTLKDQFQRNLMLGQDGRGHVWLNNQPVPNHKMNPFNLIRLVRRERQTLASLATIGVSSRKAVDLLTDFGSPEDDESGSDAPSGVFDVRDKSEDKSLITWLNDLENDQRYKHWPTNLYQITQPIYPGRFHEVGRNVINSVLVLDFSTPKSLEVVSFELTMYVQRMVPFRFGVLPLVRSDDGFDARMAMLWRHVVARHGVKGGVEFLKKTVVGHLQEGHDNVSASRKGFTAATQQPKLKSTETPEMTYEEVVAADSTYRAWLESVKAMTERIGIDEPSHFVNGKYFAWNEDHGQHLMSETPRQIGFLAQRLQRSQMSEEADVYEYLLTLPSVHARRNPYVFVSENSPLEIVDLVQGQARPFVDTLSYISTGGDSAQTTTIHLAADFDSNQGLDIALSSLLALELDQPNVRVAFIHNGQPSESMATLGGFVRQASVDGKVLPIGFWKDLLQGVADGRSFVESFKDSRDRHPEVALIAFGDSKGAEDESDNARHQFLTDFLKAKPGDVHIVVNGRVVGPITGSFSPEDFKLLISYEKESRVDKIKRLLEKAQIETSASNIMKASSIIISASKELDQGLYDINQVEITRTRDFDRFTSEETTFTVNPSVHAGSDDTLFHITAILDSASQQTQRWASILLTLSQLDNVKITVVLQAGVDLNEIPIKRFYRYVAPSELDFDSNGAIATPAAHFAGLPEPTLLTLGVDVNPAWVVTSKVCIYDLDNLKLSSLTGSARVTGVQAEFELQHILIEGFARDMTQKIPPSGAQFILGTNSQPHVADTLVMANMGYFQLKANPGVWEMVLRPGRTDQVFSIESIGSEGWVPGGVKNDKRDVVIANFEGLVLYPRLVRNPGMERANIQDEVQEEGGIWNSIKSTLKSFTGTGSNVPAKRKADINIFSVASGHLYERFLSIMILSVIKNTESRVKFWFIENFLSPSFKDFIPHMAEKYDFDYELVTYNWPHWLRAQTEKQRIIWAYKILFLDVLFPLDLDKVIFVDADQIVRTDMKELVDLDLQNAPYGYTPMCQDRVEMEGFRFWNQGYWKEHLQGKPYHISALYVVDLIRFRQMQAGDRLRGHYQQLSRDPGSLANLDQDLPNNMQTEVPIFSLPQEWLWCETWCGDEGLTKAKTIDLCNNPLTKEPKLDRARRQIKEWETLDNEATEFAKQVNAQLREARLQQQQDNIDRASKPSAKTEKHEQDVHSKKDEL